MRAQMSPTGQRVWGGPLYDRAVANVERMFNEVAGPKGEDLLQKEMAFGARISESVLSSKFKGIRSHFYEDEFGRIADFFRKVTGLPLVGFPHLPWEMQETADRKVGGWVGAWAPKRRDK
jgi:hypothetical protein